MYDECGCYKCECIDMLDRTKTYSCSSAVCISGCLTVIYFVF